MPSGESNDEFGVKVVLAHGGPSIADCNLAEQNSTKLPGCIRARRALRFIPHDELMLPIELRRDCDSVLCGPTATCVHGICVPATVDSRLCRGAGCPDTTLLPPGSTFDGGTDAPLDGPAVPEGGVVTDACANSSCPQVTSCTQLLANCGTPPTDNCCNSPLVTGGTFKRQYVVPTTVSNFRLDKYEVTIGRFRPFVDAVIAGYTPAPGSGKHAYLPSGGLINQYDNIEFSYASMAGDLERPHPWGADPITPERAIYCSVGDCSLTLPSDVGARPLGDGYFGQSDLAGGAWEWVLDGNNGYVVCTDCIFFDYPPILRAIVSGGYRSTPEQLEVTYMLSEKVEEGGGDLGVRCARPP